MKDYAEAKQIFLKYGGSSFHMAREGVLEYYRSFNVPILTEKQWLLDDFHQSYDRLTREIASAYWNTFRGMMNIAQQEKDPILFEELLKQVFITFGDNDSFTKLLVCETIINALSTFMPKSPLYCKAVCSWTSRELNALLTQVEKNEFSVDNSHRPICQSVISDENVLKRINEALSKVYALSFF